jgi:hypothetical protein
VDQDTPLLLSDPSYDTDAAGRVVLTAANPDGEALALAFPGEQAATHLHGWLTSMQAIADRTGAIGLGAVAEQMMVLQPTELAMGAIGPGRAGLVFAFGPVKLAFLVPTDQLASLLEETRKQTG